jgi:hypothetical protein
MALKVMMSSVRRGGLGPVRDAVRPLLDALGYVPIRFEDETTQPVPSRAVCVGMVKRTDIYMLLLGAEYGDPMPDTGLAPTAEEWAIARHEGKPIVVFEQAGIQAEPRQADFIREVEAYSTGVFRGTFSDTADLLGKLRAALGAAAATIQPMRPRRLAEPVAIPWRPENRDRGRVGGAALETHLVPIGGVERLQASAFRQIARQLGRDGRDAGLFEEGDPLVFPVGEEAVAAELGEGTRNRAAGISITPERVITVWEALPTQVLGAVYDEGQIASRVARDVRLAAGLDLLGCDEVVVAIGLNKVDMLGQVTGPNSMTYPFLGAATGAVRLETAEAYPTASLARIAPELGIELAARLTFRLQRR